ncbi:TadE family protein [Paenibacillus campi]|uniref:TadE/TadG family type IV pilus assembly protein n=1 Tax=Paenibacillus campi TaxID=3106031 RepID=UPI002AFEE974|nr:TadE family protein [Paenibacillus sp. SGZ-1014]
MRINRQITVIKRVKKLRREQHGSIVLEAAMVMPIFLFVAIFLVYIVHMTLLSTALNSAASDTAKYVATHMYPVKTAAQAIDNAPLMQKLSLTDLTAQYGSTFPPPLSDWIQDAASTGDTRLRQLKNQAAAAALDSAIKPLIQHISTDHGLDYELIHVTEVTVPDFTGDPYFGVELSYELPFRIPLIFKPIVLQARATERLWIGDTGEGEAASGDDSKEETGVRVVSVPHPAHPESLISIAATAPANARVKLEVHYKSGVSRAQGLGEATADANGNLIWTWKIPSSASAGWATYVLTTEDGQKIRGTFEIATYDGRPVMPAPASGGAYPSR